VTELASLAVVFLLQVTELASLAVVFLLQWVCIVVANKINLKTLGKTKTCWLWRKLILSKWTRYKVSVSPPRLQYE